MIACLAKNSRGGPLFEALSALDPCYRNLGQVSESKVALAKGALLSISWDIAKAKLQARFSPPYLRAMTAQCSATVDRASEPVSAVLYWGATNMPIDRTRQDMPYFIVTDGPFDPDDPTYPVEWKPQRWAKTYLETQREVYRSAAHVFALSEWARQKLLKVHSFEPRKVSRCGWGPIGSIGPPRLEPFQGKTVFLSIGNEWRRKGMDMLAEAGSKLREEKANAEVVIVGSPVDLTLESGPGVTIYPNPVPAYVAHSLMRDASAFVVASRFDASPHVIFEAMQYATPVIATRVCGIPEVVDDQNGTLVDPGDSNQLLNAMRSFLKTDQTKMRSAAFQTFSESGGWSAVAAHINRIIQGSL